MRIVIIDTKLDLKNGGGSNIDLHSTACALVDQGHEVSVLTVAPARNNLPPTLPYTVIEEPISDKPLGIRGKLALVSVLRRREAEAEIYQIMAPSLFIAGALYRKLGGTVPVVAHMMNYSFFCTSPERMDAECHKHCSLLDQLRHRRGHPAKKVMGSPLRVVEHYAGRLVINNIDRFMALTGPVAEVHSRHGIQPERMTLVPCKIDYATLAARSRSTLPRVDEPDSPFRIVYVGRLVRSKGVDVLLRAVGGLDFPFVVDVVGDGPVRGDLERLAGELGIASQVCFHGWQPHEATTDFYLQANVMVHPGRWPEPQGITVLEAAALGVPLIVSDIGGPVWTLQDAALRFQPDDHVDLRNQLVRLQREPALALELMTAGRKRAQLYDRSHVIRALLEVYEDVVGTHAAAVANSPVFD